MDKEPTEFEAFLRQFQPRKPRELAEPTPHLYPWARWWWATAAITILACGAVVLMQWQSWEPVRRQAVAKTAPQFQQTPSPAQAITVGALSRYLDSPEQLDAVLTAGSRSLLPDVDRPDNALHILAKE